MILNSLCKTQGEFFSEKFFINEQSELSKRQSRLL